MGLSSLARVRCNESDCMERFETLLHDAIVCRDDVKQLRVLSSGQNRARQVAIRQVGSGQVKACLSTADIS